MAHGSFLRSSRARLGLHDARVVLAALGVCALGAVPLALPAAAQSTQICASRGTSFGNSFMRGPDKDSCVTVNANGQTSGFTEGGQANVDGALGANASSLSSSSLSSAAPVTASPLTSMSTTMPSTAPVVDPWKQAR